MNGTHLRGKLLELLAVKLLWFSPYLRKFLERTRDDRFLCQRLATHSRDRDKSLNGHSSLFRHPRPGPRNARTVARNVAQHCTRQLWIDLEVRRFGQKGVGHPSGPIGRRGNLRGI